MIKTDPNSTALGTWISLTSEAPAIGTWVLMYLARYMGSDRYRAGLYMGPDEWLSAANAHEGVGSLSDRDVTHWMRLPPAPRAPGD